jgi:hypothetical protein
MACCQRYVGVFEKVIMTHIENAIGGHRRRISAWKEQKTRKNRLGTGDRVEVKGRMSLIMSMADILMMSETMSYLPAICYLSIMKTCIITISMKNDMYDSRGREYERGQYSNMALVCGQAKERKEDGNEERKESGHQ